MIYVVEGDLLKSDCHVIGHSCNCFNTMGSGVAEQVKNKYLEAFQADKNFPFAPEQRLGSCSYAQGKNGVYVFNLYGQYNYGDDEQGNKVVHTNTIALRSALMMMLQYINYMGLGDNVKIGLPYNMGCDRGGGNWEEVYSVIDYVFNFHGRDVYLYRYKGKTRFFR